MNFVELVCSQVPILLEPAWWKDRAQISTPLLGSALQLDSGSSKGAGLAFSGDFQDTTAAFRVKLLDPHSDRSF